MTRVADGKAIAAAVLAQAASAVAHLRSQGISPALAVLAATDDDGAAWYVRSIQRTAATAGVSCQVHRLPETAGAAEITGALRMLSADPAVHGIICATPLPPGISLATAGSAIAAGKDVDGASPVSLGRLAAGLPGAFPPATAAAVLEILQAGTGSAARPPGGGGGPVHRRGQAGSTAAAGRGRHRHRVPFADSGPGCGMPVS